VGEAALATHLTSLSATQGALFTTSTDLLPDLLAQGLESLTTRPWILG
jgi:hypothetical protein